MHGDNFNNPLYTVNPDVSGNNNGLSCNNINLPSTDSNSPKCGNYIASSVENIGSGKYVSVKNVFARLARNVKNKEWDMYDVAEWCAECHTEEIGMYESFAKYRGVKIQVKHNKAFVPCNIYRILSVHKDCCAIPSYQWDGAYLRFNFDDPATFGKEYTIELDYLGVMVDEEGFPMILNGTQEACYWYCMTKLYFEDYMARIIDEGRYAYLQAQMGDYVMKAKGSFRHTSRDDMNEINRILHNIIPRVRMSRNVD